MQHFVDVVEGEEEREEEETELDGMCDETWKHDMACINMAWHGMAWHDVTRHEICMSTAGLLATSIIPS